MIKYPVTKLFICNLFVHFSYTYSGKDGNMRLLSRKEEMILLAIWKLQNDDGAYGVTIRNYIEKITGIRWLFGAIYGPLGRLVDYGYVESYESDPLPERGGRRKILYRLTHKGKTELLTVNKLNKALWQDVPPLGEKS